VAAAAIAFTLINTGRPDASAVVGSGTGEGAEDELKVPVVAH